MEVAERFAPSLRRVHVVRDLRTNPYTTVEARTRSLTSRGTAMSPALLLLLPLLAPLQTLALEKTYGVPPSLLDRYAPAGESWKCLDGSKTIPWANVNNDYCDCPDGSDEPGV